MGSADTNTEMKEVEERRSIEWDALIFQKQQEAYGAKHTKGNRQLLAFKSILAAHPRAG